MSLFQIFQDSYLTVIQIIFNYPIQKTMKKSIRLFYQDYHNPAMVPNGISSNGQSDQPLINEDEQSDADWSGVREKIRQRTVGEKVRVFVENMKSLPIKKKVPHEVNEILEPKFDRWAKWKKALGTGWDPYRLDVMLVELVVLVFHAAAMWLYTCHMVLYKVDVGCFPGIYFGIIGLGIFYKINTKVLLYDRVIVDRFSIIVNYMTVHFVIDLIMVYLSIMEYASVQTSAFRLISFVILIQARIVFGKFGVLFELFKYVRVIYKLVVILLVNLFICHCVALILIVMVAKDKHPNWMDSLNITRDQDHWINTYIYAFYWAMTIMMTVGFGDITPKRIKEVIIVTFIELFSIVLLAYWLNKIQSLLIELRECEEAKIKNLQTINRLMENNRVPYDIQKIVKHDVHDMSNSVNTRYVEEENTLLDSLSPYVKDRLLQTIHIGPLLQMPLWNRMSMPTIRKIAVNLERKLYYHGEVIVGQREIPTKLLMLRDGRLRFTYSNHVSPPVITGELNQIKTRKLKRVSWLADQLEYYEATKPASYYWLALSQSLKQTPVSSSIRSLGPSLIVFIDVEKAKQLVGECDRDYQFFCMFRQQLIFSKRLYDSRCPLCIYPRHTTFHCPYFHFVPAQPLVAARHLKKLKQKPQKGQQNPRRRNNHRRDKYPWIKLADNEVLVLGSLRQKRLVSLTQLRQRQQSGKKVPVQPETIEKIDQDEGIPRVQRYLSTLREFDQVYEWEAYYPRKNIKSL